MTLESSYRETVRMIVTITVRTYTYYRSSLLSCRAFTEYFLMKHTLLSLYTEQNSTFPTRKECSTQQLTLVDYFESHLQEFIITA